MGKTIVILVCAFVLIIIFLLLFGSNLLSIFQEKSSYSSLKQGDYTCKTLAEDSQFIGDPQTKQLVLEFLQTTHRDLSGTVKVYQNLQNSGNPNIKPRIFSLASSRKELFIEVIRADPQTALNFILPKQERETITEICSNCIEEQAVIEGTVEGASGNLLGHKSIIIKTAQGEKLFLHPAKTLSQDPSPGTKIRVTGFRLDSEVLFDGNKDSLTILQPVSWVKLASS